MEFSIQRGRSFSDSRVNQIKPKATLSLSTDLIDIRVESDPIPMPDSQKRASLTSSLGAKQPSQISYGDLMGIIQYLTIYWKQMKPHLVQMDNNLGVFSFLFPIFTR